MSDVINSFRSAMHAGGIDYGGPIRPDGKLHRIKSASDQAQNSWYVLHVDAKGTAGAFGCWKRNISDKWCDQNAPMGAEQRRRIHAEIERANRQRAEEEKRCKQAARRAALWIWSQAQSLEAHPYLDKKGVRVFPGIRQYQGCIVVPLRNPRGELLSLQLIDVAGAKRFLREGQIAGTCFALASYPDGPIVICEGVATGASIHEATEALSVVCAMNCRNLAAIAKAVRYKHPVRQIIIAGDNDQWTAGNPGLTKAIDAAQAIGGRYAVPTFTDLSTKPTDFNDLHRLEGLGEVSRQIGKARFVTLNSLKHVA